MARGGVRHPGACKAASGPLRKAENHLPDKSPPPLPPSSPPPSSSPFPPPHLSFHPPSPLLSFLHSFLFPSPPRRSSSLARRRLFRFFRNASAYRAVASSSPQTRVVPIEARRTGKREISPGAAIIAGARGSREKMDRRDRNTWRRAKPVRHFALGARDGDRIERAATPGPTPEVLASLASVSGNQLLKRAGTRPETALSVPGAKRLRDPSPLLLLNPKTRATEMYRFVETQAGRRRTANVSRPILVVAN